MIPSEVNISAYERSRYLLVGIKGDVQTSGYTQRPTAERKAKWSGYGLYDRKTGEWVLEVNLERRREVASESAEAARRKLAKAMLELDAIEDAVHALSSEAGS